jgi:hypothetical protein
MTTPTNNQKVIEEKPKKAENIKTRVSKFKEL